MTNGPIPTIPDEPEFFDEPEATAMCPFCFEGSMTRGEMANHLEFNCQPNGGE